jgi:hypothetical protein
MKYSTSHACPNCVLCASQMEDVLRIIFDFYNKSYESPYKREEAVTSLSLTCQQWRHVARSYYPYQQILGIQHVYPDFIRRIDFDKKTLQLSDSSEKNLSKDAVIKHGKSFLDIFARLPCNSHLIPCTSQLVQIDFDDHFNIFDPKDSSTSLHRCEQLQRFSFQGEKCV